MKKLATTIGIMVLLTTSFYHSSAQAWERNSKVLGLGFGASQFFHVDGYYYNGPGIVRGWFWPITGQINFQGEFGVHKYVGLGFTTGLGGRGPLPGNFFGEINMPIGFLANFHFYQLIADHSSRDIHADKLDIYAGINVGSGFAATFYTNTTRVIPIVFGGPHVGIRYYFSPKVGVNGEFGFGKSLINAGFVFKI